MMENERLNGRKFEWLIKRLVGLPIDNKELWVTDRKVHAAVTTRMQRCLGEAKWSDLHFVTLLFIFYISGGFFSHLHT